MNVDVADKHIVSPDGYPVLPVTGSFFGQGWTKRKEK